jgi:hypothetical protein
VAGWGCPEHPGVGCCKLHGGKSPNGNKHAQIEQIKQAAMRISGSGEVPTTTDAIRIIMGTLNATWWNVHRYEALVDELPTHPEPDKIVGTKDDGSPIWERGKPGLYGLTYHQSGVPTGEAKKHILLQMLDEEREKAFKAAVEAAKLGIDERRLQLAEAQATDLFRAVGDAMTAASLSPDQAEAFRRALAQSLRRPEPTDPAR